MITKKVEMLNQRIKLTCEQSKMLITGHCDDLFPIFLCGKSFNKISSSHVKNENIICRGKKDLTHQINT